jgi:xanthine dehydrogenase YagR molybdenum-binding subunit
MTIGIIAPTEVREQVTGKPIDRVDGRLKVMGAAHYAAEFPINNIAHAVIIQSTIAKGRIQDIDVSATERSPGVLAAITHRNAPKLNELQEEDSVKGRQSA